MSPITSFPSDGYDGIVIERNIPLTSMCSHHHQTIGGVVHIGYIAGEGATKVSDDLWVSRYLLHRITEQYEGVTVELHPKPVLR